MKRNHPTSVSFPYAVGPILVACLAISLAGCVLRGAPKTTKALPPAPKPEVAPTPPPPQPLSTPQTNVELPKPQPLDPEALVMAPSTIPETIPETNQQRPGRRPPVSTVKPEVVAPPPPEPERPAIQEIIPAAEQKRLQDSVQRRKSEIARILNLANNRRQTRLQQGVVESIKSFVNLADEAEKHGDFRQADALAERAQILARQLQNAL